MNVLRLELEHCYGIRKLTHTFEFDKSRAVAIYAPNGLMKSSLAKTFKDVAEGKESSDRMFKDRENVRIIVDENGVDLDPESVLIIQPYDEQDFKNSEKISTLLVNASLRQEYESLNVGVEKAKNVLLTTLKTRLGSRRDLATEISSTFTHSPEKFNEAIMRIAHEVDQQSDTPLAEIPYDLVFDERVVEMLEQPQVQKHLNDYIKRFNELIDQSKYFKRGIFTYYNASNIAKALTENGFFKASHSVHLNGENTVEINAEKQLEKLIDTEKEAITSDTELRKNFSSLEKLLIKNKSVREFNAYIAEHEDILPALSNFRDFKEQVWKSYFVEHREIFNQLVNELRDASTRRTEIEEVARNEQTAWDEVIKIFNERFYVPFELKVINFVPVVLNEEKIPKLGFVFRERELRKDVGKDDLMEVLSTGERRAFYLLNVIFEIRARQRAKQKTLLIIDDVADSFDYKNKFAIIQYLKEISEQEMFRQVILTHNFDFFRTVESRFVSYASCFMATKNENEITIKKATGIKNVFVKDWKVHFGSNPRKRIACIPFMRNLLEYTKGVQDADYKLLTSLLHIKSTTETITDTELFDCYKRVFHDFPTEMNVTAHTVLELIFQEADKCLSENIGANLENKIVLSIASRLRAEQFMIDRLCDFVPTLEISSNQTTDLLRHFRQTIPNEHIAIHTIDQIVLMTPENIHLNSFMYEPILDMSDDHLRQVYSDVKALETTS